MAYQSLTDQAVEAPRLLQRIAQQVALGHGSSAHGVVGGHHRPGAGLVDRPFERGHVQLTEGPLVELDAEGVAFRLGVVADVVLRAAADAVRLEAAHEGRRDPAGQQRILGELLEVAPAERGAMQVDRRAEQDVDALRPGLAGQQRADFADQLFIPARGQGGRAGKAGRRLVVPDEPPFTPAGPSETMIWRRPAWGAAYVVQKSTPVSRRTFVARSSRTMAFSTAASTMAS